MEKEFDITINFNGKDLNPVVISPHFLKKHNDISYETILVLVKALDGISLPYVGISGGWQYYKVEPIFYNKKPFHLILGVRDGYSFLGVVNVFRVKEGKNYEK